MSTHHHHHHHPHSAHEHSCADHGNHLLESRSRNTRQLAAVLVLVLVYMLAEIVGGILTNSLALLADAGHMLSDAASLSLSLFAFWLVQRPASRRHTYGYYRTEILVALINGISLVVISIFIFVEAFERVQNPEPIHGSTMLWIAAGGLLVNLVSLVILHRGSHDNLNVRGAWLHVFSDMLGSVGVIVAGLLIWLKGWNWADPVASVLIGLFVLHSAWGLLKETVFVLMEGAPGHIDVNEVGNAISRVSGVCSIHDLHVWTITSGLVALSVHVTTDGHRTPECLLEDIQNKMFEQFAIDHTTIQIEPVGYKERKIPV